MMVITFQVMGAVLTVCLMKYVATDMLTGLKEKFATTEITFQVMGAVLIAGQTKFAVTVMQIQQLVKNVMMEIISLMMVVTPIADEKDAFTT